jgi:hypothetical protein
MSSGRGWERHAVQTDTKVHRRYPYDYTYMRTRCKQDCGRHVCLAAVARSSLLCCEVQRNRPTMMYLGQRRTARLIVKLRYVRWNTCSKPKSHLTRVFEAGVEQSRHPFLVCSPVCSTDVGLSDHQRVSGCFARVRLRNITPRRPSSMSYLGL